MKNSIAALYLIVVAFNFSCGQDTANQVATISDTPFTPELLVEDVAIPWGIAFLPDGSMLITEKSGELILFKDGQKNTLSNVPEVYSRGQGGLLDVAVHPDYENNGWIYLSYASEEGEEKGGHTAFTRAKISDNSLTNSQLLYKGSPNTTKGQHFGSRIEFDDKGYVYLSIGERGARDDNPQDITRDGGKIYRFYDDGRIPEDNPFVGTEGAKTAIYSYGHRNPQGLIKNPKTGDIWDNEHGPKGGDEINIIKPGANYGWPVITYGVNYSGTPITDKTAMDGMEQPIHYWLPSIAPSGMAFITTDNYGADWNGSLLVGSLKFQYLELLKLNGTKVTDRIELIKGLGRVRDVVQGPDGLIYVGVEGKGVYKLVPKK
ncbi:PQQ-dependent sugar dehydrogenase [Aurantibacter crassamenti]|uniref:PQQ-dependent sugar dehydrogenase n=1 Tax=Aurantibacter crassamenti TaxID=1837375 RepID=UPI0019394B81|nr:PQQ-dependent sugar dehydrogenase [Aurantibacter crassamenti]MBM1106725.1 PQQ-dependent sugar dehydrogenase [Aurantibacter crassamenti]